MTLAMVQQGLKSIENLPEGVEGWSVEVGEDATGDEAVWVWVTVRDNSLDAQGEQVVRDLVRSAVREVGGEAAPWVYVLFRSASEVEAELS